MKTDLNNFDVSTKAGLVAFYEENFDAVYRYAAKLTRGNRATTEDLVQEAFLRLTRTARQGDLRTVGVGWMITTVRRIHIDRLRSSEREDRRVRLVSDTERERSLWANPSPSGKHLLAGLTDREQTALVLRYVDDLSVGEVAEQLGVSISAAQSLLQRAKSRARNQEALK